MRWRIHIAVLAAQALGFLVIYALGLPVFAVFPLFFVLILTALVLARASRR